MEKERTFEVKEEPDHLSTIAKRNIAHNRVKTRLINDWEGAQINFLAIWMVRHREQQPQLFPTIGLSAVFDIKTPWRVVKRNGTRLKKRYSVFAVLHTCTLSAFDPHSIRQHKYAEQAATALEPIHLAPSKLNSQTPVHTFSTYH